MRARQKSCDGAQNHAIPSTRKLFSPSWVKAHPCRAALSTLAREDAWFRLGSRLQCALVSRSKSISKCAGHRSGCAASCNGRSKAMRLAFSSRIWFPGTSMRWPKSCARWKQQPQFAPRPRRGWLRGSRRARRSSLKRTICWRRRRTHPRYSTYPRQRARLSLHHLPLHLRMRNRIQLRPSRAVSAARRCARRLMIPRRFTLLRSGRS